MGADSITGALERMGKYVMKDRLLATGLFGTIVTALCCFTPALVILLGAIGLSVAIGYLDIILLPALAVFLAITGYAIWRRKHHQ